MSRIRGLELVFNLEKKNITSREDCVVAAFHCLLINEGLQCVGIGDEWPESDAETTTELLPKDWSKNHDVYSLRYVKKEPKSRVLLKIVKANHMLLVNVVMNEDAIASMSVPVEKHISDNYTDYSTTYKDLESLSESFRKEIMEKIQPKIQKPRSSTETKKKVTAGSSAPSQPAKPQMNLREERNPHRFPFPRVGGNDLDPFAVGGGGMLMDPSSFGIPGRPTMPQFGIGGPHGLPRGSVPPGARFDPFMPPTGRFNPDPDHFRPPDDDYIL